MIISTFYKTSWYFDALKTLELPNETKIKYFGKQNANDLKAVIRSRNVFTRHSWENNYYLNQVDKLGDQTIVEVILSGEPKDTIDFTSHVADSAEKVVLLSTIFTQKKEKFSKLLGITELKENEIKFIVDSDFKYLRSKSKNLKNISKIIINDNLIKRFNKNGFPELFKYCTSNQHLSNRINQSIRWLLESRLETSVFSSVVKTSIALESLLVFNQSEPLAKVLSERCAFLLSPNVEKREEISSIIKKFYNFRSGIVHGGKKRMKNLSIDIIDSVDRLLVMVYLILSNNKLWQTEESIENWCNKEKWRSPSENVIFPYSRNYFNQALKLANK